MTMKNVNWFKVALEIVKVLLLALAGAGGATTLMM